MTNEELVEKIQNGIDVQENMGILYEQNKPIIFKIVKPYSKIIDIEDLMQEAYFGLYNAALKFDIKSEYKFLTYARYSILGKVNRYCKNTGKMKRLPVNLLEQISKYYKFIKDYEENNNEKPSDDEIIQHLKISKKRLNELKKYIVEDNVNSLNDQIGEDYTLENVIADEHMIEQEICDKMMNQQLKNELWNEVDKLPIRTSQIIKSRYKENKSRIFLASKENISPSRIEQIEYQGLKELSENKKVRELAQNYYYDTSIAYKGSFKSFKESGCSIVERMVIKKVDNEQEILKQLEEIRNKRNRILESIR